MVALAKDQKEYQRVATNAWGRPRGVPISLPRKTVFDAVVAAAGIDVRGITEITMTMTELRITRIVKNADDPTRSVVYDGELARITHCIPLT